MLACNVPQPGVAELVNKASLLVYGHRRTKGEAQSGLTATYKVHNVSDFYTICFAPSDKGY